MWFGFVKAVYIVQTIDNNLHFISENDVRTYTIELPYPNKPTCSVIKYGEDAHQQNSLVPLNPPQITESHSESEEMALHPVKFKDQSNIVKMDRRIDDIYITREGYILFQNQRIDLNELYTLPFMEDGIYISATRDHIPRIVNNTFVLTTTVIIKILDLTNGDSKEIRFSYLTYLFEAYKKFKIEDNRILINNKMYTLSDTIVAVYESVSRNGLNYMVKLFNNSYVDVYIPRVVKRSYGTTLIFTSVLGLALLFFLLRRSNFSFNRTISKKEGIYEGKFVNKNSLIYITDKETLNHNLEFYKIYKDSFFVSIYFEGYRMFSPVIVTERTSQFPYVLDFNESQEKGVFLIRLIKGVFHRFKRLLEGRGTSENNANEEQENSLNEQIDKNNSDLTELNDKNIREHKEIEQKRPIEAFDNQSDIISTEVNRENKIEQKSEPAERIAINSTESSDFRKFKNIKVDIKKSLFSFAGALERIHSRGKVHSKICPENLRVSEHGDLKFQTIFMNMGWRSKNQITNAQNAKKRQKDEFKTTLSHADDIFSFGCVVHYHLTGYHPFDLRNFLKLEKKKSICSPEFKRQEYKSEIDVYSDESLAVLNTADPKIDKFTSSLEENLTNNPNDIKSNPENKSKLFESTILNEDPLDSHHYSDTRNKETNTSQSDELFDSDKTVNKLCKSPTFEDDKFIKANTTNNKVFNNVEKINKMIYKKTIPDKLVKYIENNILFKSHCIRISDQIDHDFVYHCIITQNISISKHPFFWSNSKKIDFISDFSDFIETNSHLKKGVERFQHLVFEKSWTSYIDIEILQETSMKKRYDHRSLTGLIRLIRNINRHYQEMSAKMLFENSEGKLCGYFLDRFPELFMILYKNKDIRSSDVFEKYF